MLFRSSLDTNIVGESVNSKLNKITNYLKKNKSDYIFISAPENVAWTLNIRGGDGPNSPIPNSRLIVSKSKKILLISNLKKCKWLLNNKVIKKDELIPREILKTGDRVKAYCYEVKREYKGHQIFLSRAHPQFLAKLFFQEEIGRAHV